MGTTFDEKFLLQHLKRDDGQTFRLLFRQYYRYLTTIAWRMVRDAAAAEDLVQDVFAELWKRRHDLPDDLLVKSYLRQAVVNKAINFLQKQKRFALDDTPQASAATGSFEAHYETEIGDLKALVTYTVDALPDKCRAIFSMSRYEEMSNREIAERLDISIKTVENQMTIALRRLRDALREGGFIAFAGIVFWL
jgi:RNA polymerase sigma-70 factor (ECF subfamily)